MGYKFRGYGPGTTIEVNESYEGETIEQKVRRIVENNEPIDDGGKSMIYTDRRDGVLPEYNIRTDRFEVALEAMDKASKSHVAKRQRRMEENDQGIGKETMEKRQSAIGGPESIQATDNQ